ncbi:UDP-N-acetylglucosamine 1-carboxyvinyltransferase [Indioceanicola profundi]|uniref:UDP-N-acetylglucosamine 1-carboxyvinyltransferase n=1 Tax=Indioceanicola profundi TaxID=2220096 RepID=UPI000E6AE2C8|nr:UDP-N-acetylglucosamine 1-carboxyvinyltransferase [Indioceanicola profundi]
MDKLRIRGGRPLIGDIQISGAKNAALPLLAACLLSDETLTLTNLPHLADISTMANLLAQHGVDIRLNGDEGAGSQGRTIELNAGSITSLEAPYDLVRKMRASVLVLGPLVARFGQAKVSLPGGCAIGPRPVDLHIKGLQAMGAQIEIEGGYVLAKAPAGGLTGAEFVFPQVSVGATENLMMAACLAKGQTTLVNAAREPEIGDLAKCLIAMGAVIEGAGTDRIRITGVDRLHAATHEVVGDRIEAGTYAMAAAITGGDLHLLGGKLDHIRAVATALVPAEVVFQETEQGFRVRRANGALHGVDVMTEPFPGFPTDLQAQMMSLMCVAQGASMITETIFENRFMHVPELMRMGANITVHGSSALVRGVPKLTGAPVMATDLRASVSLVLAGLAAEGETVVNRIYHLDRGYERIEQKLSACGADMERLRETS